VALCLVLPPLLGYGYLYLRGVQLGTNASYDAYKVLAVFYPGLLAALVYWVTLDRQGWRRVLVVICGMGVGAMNLVVTYRCPQRMENPPLMVGSELLQLRKIEARADVASLNLRIPDMWSRLWANSLLLRKPQFFETHTYEGRLNTPLRGAWDLNGGLVTVLLPEGGSERINAQYALVSTASRYFLRAWLGEGWHGQEQLARTATRWHWTKGDAGLRIDNPQGRSLRVVLRFNVRSEIERDLQLWLNGQRLRTAKIGTELKVVQMPEIMVPAGTSVLELRSSTPPTRPGGSDSRPLGFAMYGIEIEVKADTDETDN
jgi:hypothetical protein